MYTILLGFGLSKARCNCMGTFFTSSIDHVLSISCLSDFGYVHQMQAYVEVALSIPQIMVRSLHRKYCSGKVNPLTFNVVRFATSLESDKAFLRSS